MVPAYMEDTDTCADWDDKISDPDGRIRELLEGDVTDDEGYDEDVGTERAALPTLSSYASGPGVGAVFCDGQFNDKCKKHGLTPGFALDLRTGWNFAKTSRKEEALRLTRKEIQLF